MAPEPPGKFRQSWHPQEAASLPYHVRFGMQQEARQQSDQALNGLR
jgi:hypothetical protein